MSSIKLIIFSVILMGCSGLSGSYLGERNMKIKVFKNCLNADINPNICLQYMKDIERGQ